MKDKPKFDSALNNKRVISATGSDLGPLGRATLLIKIGSLSFEHSFLVCKHLRTPIILGFDAHRCHKLGTGWTPQGQCYIHCNQMVLVYIPHQKNVNNATLIASQEVIIPPRSIVTCLTQTGNLKSHTMYETSTHHVLLDLYPNLQLVHMNHHVIEKVPNNMPLCLINLGHYSVVIPKYLPIAHLNEFKPNVISEVQTKPNQALVPTLPITPHNSKLISSPADIQQHSKVILPTSNVPSEAKNGLNKICHEFQDIVSTHAGDIGHTKLITMEIDTGNNPPIAQKPYTLALKHHE